MTRAPIEWAAPTILDDVDACDAGSPEAKPTVEDWGDPRVPAMCDERGASVIAPQRVLPMTDARIEVAPGCGADGTLPALGPGSQDAPAPSALPALAQHAVLAGQLRVLPASFVLAPDFLPIVGRDRVGYPRGIDDPPRCA